MSNKNTPLTEEVYKQLCDPSPIIQYYFQIKPNEKEEDLTGVEN